MTWRVGHKLGRTLYDGDALVGLVDTAEQASAIVTAMNVVPKMPRTIGRDELIIDAVTRIAQKACRNGESGAREWPSLYELPYVPAWRCVGETYLAELRAALYATHIVDTVLANGGDK